MCLMPRISSPLRYLVIFNDFLRLSLSGISKEFLEEIKEGPYEDLLKIFFGIFKALFMRLPRIFSQRISQHSL